MHVFRLIGPAIAMAAIAACRPPGVHRSSVHVDEDRIFQQLAILALGTPLTAPELATARSAAATTGERIDALADRLVDDPRFAPSLASGLFDRLLDSFFPDGSVLKHTPTDAGATPIYFLRSPCKPAEAETVQPWWDPSSTVRVCPDSYRPEVVMYEAGAGIKCDSLAAQVSGEHAPICGCGPNLLRCYRDQAHQEEVAASLADEVRQTFAYVVRTDQPVARAFTMNATIRDRNVEAVYRRWRVIAGEPASVLTDLMAAPWPRHDEPTPRLEIRAGQHAGILTAAAMQGLATPRDRLKHISEKMWCIEPTSARVSTHTILELGATDLRAGEGWRKLAAMPVCNTCHARLDYGMQFFSGFGDMRRRIGYDPRAQQDGRGPMYLVDIDDRRGDAELSPTGFAAFAVAQPEFSRCMVKQIAQHVLGVDETPQDQLALETAYETSNGSLKAVVRDALRIVGHGFERGADRTPAVPPGVLPGPAPSSSTIALSADVRDIVERRCADCHDANDDLPALSGKAVPRSVAERMLSAVALGKMPKGFGGIAPADRERMTTELADTLWAPGTPANRAARLFFIDQQRGAPVHDVVRLINLVDRGAGATTGNSWEVVRSETDSASVLTFDMSPGMAGIVAFEALAACKKAGHVAAADLAACMDRAIDPALIFRGP
jgi:hypothetical protein